MGNSDRFDRRTWRNWSLFFRRAFPVAIVGAIAFLGLSGMTATAQASPLVAQANPPEPPPPTCIKCPTGYHCVHHPEGCKKDKKSSMVLPTNTAGQRTLAVLQSDTGSSAHTMPAGLLIAQNDNWVACYKEADNSPKLIKFRLCPKDKPYTPTNQKRNFCYRTAADCARAEMPQTWCIKCEGKKE